VDAVGQNDLKVTPYERALLLFYGLRARRRSAVVGLRARDLWIEPDKVIYRARVKRGETKWKELPPPAWKAIRRYLDLDGREPTGDDPIFTATTDAGQCLRDYYGTPKPERLEPLTGEAVAQALKRYTAYRRARAGMRSRIDVVGFEFDMGYNLLPLQAALRE